MKTAIYLVVVVLLMASCKSPQVVLLERADYQFTRPGDTIMRGTNVLADVSTGIWYREGAHLKLQQSGYMPLR